MPSKFAKRLRRLRENYPTPIPTQVRFVTAEFLCRHYGQPAHGGATFRNGRAVIHIDRAGSVPVQIDTLIHEWAHVHDDPSGQRADRHEHCNGWGECYARAYRAAESVKQS